MTYDAQKVVIGREPITVIELDLGYCSLSYGVGACTAGQVASDTAQAGAATTITLAAGDTQADDYYNNMVIKITGGTGSGQEKTITDYVSSTKVATVDSAWTTNPDATSTYTIHEVLSSDACYNTRATCQDPANYDETTQTYRFCQPFDNMPVGVSMIPCIEGDVSRAPTTTTAGKGLGKRAVVKVMLNDFTWHDRDIDKYIDQRTYDAETTGTYWGKFLARNPYYEQREMRVLSGYVTDPWDWANFETEYYDITDIKGPDRGKITIVGKDVLSRTYSNKKKYPATSTGELSAGITDVATSATLSPSGVGNDEYPASGYVSIGSEAMAFTRSGDVLTLTRAQFGTTAASHSAGDTVQLSAAWSGTNVVDVLYELLVTGAGIPDAYIPYDDGATGVNDNWDDEKDLWLSASSVTGILMKPEAIEKVIGELSEVFIFDIWWDAVAQEIQIKALSPEPSGVTINTLEEDYDILADSVKIERDSDKRVTTCRVFYNKLDHSEPSDPEKFAGLYITTDSSAESAEQYGSSSIKDVYSRWFNDQAQAAALAGRYIARFADTPLIVTFEIDNKNEDDLSMAQRVEIDTKQIQSVTGANAPTKFQVTEIVEVARGATKKIKGIQSSFTGRYWFICPDSVPDYSSATEAQKNQYGFVCYDTNVFLDGEPAYKII